MSAFTTAQTSQVSFMALARGFSKTGKAIFEAKESHHDKRENAARRVSTMQFIAHHTQALISILFSLGSAACPSPAVVPSPAVSVCCRDFLLVLLRFGFFFFFVVSSPSAPSAAVASGTALPAESFAADFVGRGAAPAWEGSGRRC